MVTDPGKEWIIFAMFAFVATVMAAYWGVAAMATRWLMTRRAGALILAVPLIWLGIEYMHEFNTPALPPAAAGHGHYRTFAVSRKPPTSLASTGLRWPWC
ncbi:MAG: hypothetical protein IPK62_17295 [Bacteroidetes bacterium]|nr:hypothetical protein [Bacteroidota bacterium]